MPARLDIALDDQTFDEARAAVGALAVEFDLAAQNRPYQDLVWHGTRASRAKLHLDDVSAIPFLLSIAGVEQYQHRARTRAGDGDFFAASTPVTPGYEDYCRDALGMGQPTLVEAIPEKNRLAVADACTRGEAFATLVDAARRRDGLVIHPYMGIEDVWQLARRIQDESGTSVSVIAPPPPAAWIANDKASLSRVVRAVLGDEYLVETHTTVEPVLMARALQRLATRHDRVGLKRTRCASAMGNVVYDSEDILVKSEHEVAAVVGAFLERTEWPTGEEVLAVAWEQTDLSPSTQLWIPPLGGGNPRLDGIYEQILEGEEKVFLGSRPSGLPEAIDRTMGEAALKVAAGLQALGYTGRCSFDHLVVGDPATDVKVVFTECNGRWGGTSTPMALVDRLVPGPRPPYRAQDFVHPDLIGVPFGDILARVGDHLYDPTSNRGTFIFYNVGPLEKSGKLDVIALGETQDDAEYALLEHLPSLLGL